jgi:hypothetical protein
MNLIDTGYMVSIGLALDRDKYQTPAYTVMNLDIKQEVLERINCPFSFHTSRIAYKSTHLIIILLLPAYLLPRKYVYRAVV